MKYLLAILLVTALQAEPQPEKLVIYEGVLGLDPSPSPLTALLNQGWTVKHMVAYSKSAANLAVVLSPPSQEWIEHNKAKAEAAREEARKAREEKVRKTKLEK